MRVLKRTALSLAALLCVGSPTLSAAPDRMAEFRYEGDFRYQVADEVSVYELWYSSEQLILSPSGAVIRYFSFDWESAPRDKEWIAQGVVIAGTADTGTTPVAIRLWSRERSRLQTELSRTLSGERGLALAIFTPSLPKCLDEALCPPQRMQISATREGEVLVGTTYVGTIK